MLVSLVIDCIVGLWIAVAVPLRDLYSAYFFLPYSYSSTQIEVITATWKALLRPLAARDKLFVSFVIMFSVDKMVVDKYVVKSLIYKGFSVYQQVQERQKKEPGFLILACMFLFCRRKLPEQRLELPSRPLTEVVKSDSSLLGLQNRFLLCLFVIVTL